MRDLSFVRETPVRPGFLLPVSTDGVALPDVGRRVSGVGGIGGCLFMTFSVFGLPSHRFTVASIPLPET